MNQLQLPLKPSPGQWLLAIDLSAINPMTITTALNQLMLMGYAPRLCYQETTNGTKYYALLKNQLNDSMTVIPDDHAYDELMALHEFFPDAIWSARGLPVRSPVAA